MAMGENRFMSCELLWCEFSNIWITKQLKDTNWQPNIIVLVEPIRFRVQMSQHFKEFMMSLNKNRKH